MDSTESIPTIPDPTKPVVQDFEVPPPPPPKKSRDGLKSILFTICIIIAAPLLAYLMSMYVFQSYRVDGQSMESTLQDNDRLIVWKFSRTWAGVRGKTYMPEREQIVVFTEKQLLDANGKPKAVIKRVIGLPGDRVTVRDGKVTVYTTDKPKGYNPDESQTFSSQIQKPTDGNVDVTVPEGHVFVLGDNRPNSLDSRYFGTIPTEDIRGTASLRIAPVNNMTNL